MRILLTNDDGIDAPGLAALERAVGRLGVPIVTVAPVEPHSGCGHRVTTDRPLAVIDRGAGRHAVAGTPADCVRLALAQLAPATTFVIAGINAGGNLGVDVHHSGTVAAAREAALHGRRALAVSQYHRRGSVIDWERAAAWLEALLPGIVAPPADAGAFWNVNLPDLAAGAPAPGIVTCPVDESPFALGFRSTAEGWHYAASYHDRPRVQGGDVAVCFGGAISVSRVRVV